MTTIEQAGARSIDSLWS